MQKSKVLSSFKRRKETILINYQKAATTSFRLDCETFLELFEKEQTLSYVDFAKTWQLMNFTYIFADQNFTDILETLCDICFAVAKKCIYYQKSIFIRIGAFYMLYGLYYKQPIKGLVKIRLTLDEYNQIKNLMNDMKERNQLEPLYILAKMKADGAFHFVAHFKQIKIKYGKDLKAYSTIDETFQEKSSLASLSQFKDILKDESILKLQETCNKYEAALKRNASRYPNIDQFKSTVMDALHTAHQKVFHYSTQSEENNVEEKELKNKRLDVKSKAMKNMNAEYRGAKNVITSMDMEN